MQHQLPELPYAKNALAPHLSAETLQYHHDKHHAAYVAKLNDLISGTEFENTELDGIVTGAPAGPIFNNAAQHWNHSFYWKCMAPGGGEPSGELADAIARTFGSFDGFRTAWAEAGAGLFGSGYVWLTDGAGGLEIVPKSNAGNPLTDGKRPLLTMDVWEHAYYIDHRNARPEHIKHFLEVVDWGFVASNLR